MLKRILKAVGVIIVFVKPSVAGPSSPPAGNYIVNITTTASQPIFNVSSGTVNQVFNLPGITSGQCIQTTTGGRLVGTGAPCGSGGGVSVYPATSTAMFPFGFTASTATFSKQIKSEATASGTSQGTSGAFLINASSDTGIPSQIYTNAVGQASYFGLQNLIAANTNYANAYLYVLGTSSITGKANVYIQDPSPNIQLTQSGIVAPAGQYEFTVIGDTLQFRATNNSAVYKARIGMTHPGVLTFYETSDNGRFVGLKAPATVSANVTWILPNADGSSGQVLTTDGSGNLSWATPSGGNSSGTVNSANQLDIPYYSVSGSSNVLSGSDGFQFLPGNDQVVFLNADSSELAFNDITGNTTISSIKQRTDYGFSIGTSSGVAINDTVGVTGADHSAVLDLQSTTRGFLPPQLTTTERDAIVSPATGLEIYNTDNSRYEFFDGIVWGPISTGGSGGSTPLEVFVGASLSSPTASITAYTGDFIGSVIGGTTFQFALNPATTDFIHNQSTHQTAIFNVSSGSIAGPLAIADRITYGIGSTGGLNTYTIRYQDVGAVNAYSGWDNTNTYFWSGSGGVGDTKMTLRSSTGLLNPKFGVVTTTLTATAFDASPSSVSVTAASGLYTRYETTAGSITVRNVASGTQCLQADANGHITGTGSTCASASGGALAFEVFNGAVRSSPTASISLNVNDFQSSVTGSTFTFALNSNTTDFIHNQTTLQSATFNVSSGTVNDLYVSTITVRNMVKTDDGTSLLYLSPGHLNLFLGYGAGNLTLTGFRNTAVGYTGLSNLTSGIDNVAEGPSALQNMTSGNSNTGVGSLSGLSITSGNGNVAMGLESLYSGTTGSSNTCIGSFSGWGEGGFTVSTVTTTGSGNTFIGYSAAQDAAAQINNSIALGYKAKVNTSNTAQIGGRIGSGSEVMVQAASATVNQMTVSNLASGQCVQTGTGGLLTVTGSGCATSGGTSSPLEVFVGAARSSPTASITANTSQFTGSVTGSTFTFALNSSSVTLQGNTNVALLNSTQTFSGGNTFLSSSTFADVIDSSRSIIMRNSSTIDFYSPDNLVLDGSIRAYQDDFGKMVANGFWAIRATPVSNISLTIPEISAIGPSSSTFTYGLSAGSMSVTSLASGQCVQTGTGGLLTVTGSACGSGGGGGSPIALTTGTYGTTYSNPAVSTPTLVFVADQSQFGILASGTTGYFGIRDAISSVSGNYTLTSSSTLVLADASGGSLTVTLPTAVGISGKVYTIKRISTGANTVTIATTSSQTIDGATTQLLGPNWSVDLISDNANWRIE